MTLDDASIPSSLPWMPTSTVHNQNFNHNDLRRKALIGAHVHRSPRHHSDIGMQFMYNSSQSSTADFPPTLATPSAFASQTSPSFMMGPTLPNHSVIGPSEQASSQFQLQRPTPQQTEFLIPSSNSNRGIISNNYVDMSMVNGTGTQEVNRSLQMTEPVPLPPQLHKISYLRPSTSSSARATTDASPSHSYQPQSYGSAPSSGLSMFSSSSSSFTPVSSSTPRVFGWMPQSEEDLTPVVPSTPRYHSAPTVTPKTKTSQSPNQNQIAIFVRRTSATKSASIPISIPKSVPVPIFVGSSQPNRTNKPCLSQPPCSSSSLGLNSSSDSSSASLPSQSASLTSKHKQVSNSSAKPVNPVPQVTPVRSGQPPTKVQQPPPPRRDARLDVNPASFSQTQTSVQESGTVPIQRVPLMPSKEAPSALPEVPARLAAVPPSPQPFRYFVPIQNEQQNYQDQHGQRQRLQTYSQNAYVQTTAAVPSQQSEQLQPPSQLPLSDTKLPQSQIAGRKRKATQSLQGEQDDSRDALQILKQSLGDNVASPIIIPSRSSSPVVDWAGSVSDSNAQINLPLQPLSHTSTHSPTMLAAVEPSPAPSVRASPTAVASTSHTHTDTFSSTSATATTTLFSPTPSSISTSTLLPPSDHVSITDSSVIALHHTNTLPRKKLRLDSALSAPTVQELMVKAWDLEKKKQEKEVKVPTGYESRVQSARTVGPCFPLSYNWIPMVTESVLEFDIEHGPFRSGTHLNCVSEQYAVDSLSNYSTPSSRPKCLGTRTGCSCPTPLSSSGSSSTSTSPIWKPVWVGGNKI
ncbi:hypothetical protein GGU10DRAFT_388073 [Lentinula aff. detonsa]|uniref:Uncharacterized protein n=1 Tax=Lentinula aff. detonsa TaxID=2804958 RepID=A0AA38NIY3_9AGAR|nr:hypothetical protein GGU10DRAFT_388073 [Lentinula aff. detonsa]